MLARAMGGFGRSLITVGTLILLFVAYQLWGTGLQEARSQDKLRSEFDQVIQRDATSTTTTPTTSTTTSATTTSIAFGTPPTTAGLKVIPTKVVAPDIALPDYGDAIAEIKIPKIGVTRTVVEGVGLDQLKRGPGHYPETPLPGQAGNASIAGHRTTYGQPFHNVDKLDNGDRILVKTRQGDFVYSIDRVFVVEPDQSEVLLPTKGKDGRLENRITLTACHPKYSAAQRMIVTGVLIGKPEPELAGQAKAREKAQGEGRDSSRDTVSGPEVEVSRQPVSIDGGLSGVKQSKTPAILWGLVCALIWLATWLAQTVLRRRVRAELSDDDAHAGGRRILAAPSGEGGPVGAGTGRRVAARPTRGQRLLTWSPYLVGLPVFLVALYVFFENFGRLLPGNY